MGTFSSLCSDIVDFGTANSNPRYKKVSKITPHHMAGQMGGVQCANFHLSGGRQASANYYIGSDGKICGGVCEERRAWTSSSPDNDQAAITMEISNNSGDPNWTVSDEAYKAAIRLCADICKRYGIDPHYDGTANGTITMHKQFAATGCPGPYLESLIVSGKFEQDIKDCMNQGSKPDMSKPNPSNTPTKDKDAYKVRYSSHVQTFGWLGEVGDGETSGTQDQAKRLECIKIWIPGHDVSYRMHIQKQGDTKTVKNGKPCGTTGKALRAEAIWIDCPDLQLEYRAWLEGIGWTAWVSNGQWCGTKGEKRRMEAVQIRVKQAKSDEEIAREVIQGKWGNGAERERKLTAAGYNYDAIQAEVNRLLK